VPDAAAYVPGDAHRASKQPILSQGLRQQTAEAEAGTGEVLGQASPAAPATPKVVHTSATSYPAATAGHLPTQNSSVQAPAAATAADSPMRGRHQGEEPLPEWPGSRGGPAHDAIQGAPVAEEGQDQGLLGSVAAAAANTTAAAWEATKSAVGSVTGGGQPAAPAAGCWAVENQPVFSRAASRVWCC
jgi:hypothetical protein